MQKRLSRRFRRMLAIVCGALGVAGLSRAAHATDPTAPVHDQPVARPHAREGVAETVTKQSLASIKALGGQPIWLPPEGGLPGVLAYPPKHADEPARITVMLHGMCDPPQNECSAFAPSVTGDQWLICPRADVECGNGGSMWGFRTRQRTVEAAIGRIREMYPGAMSDASDRTLIGFSLGAFAAVDIAHQGEGKWTYVILLGAKIQPDARRLTRAGVRSVLLGSGDFDMMKWHMVDQARRLDRAGMRSSYVSMGRVGHWFARDMDGWMANALAWLHAGEGVDSVAPIAVR